MAQIFGKSMRFVVHVPVATGRRIIRRARDMGLAEWQFVTAGLVLGSVVMQRARRSSVAELIKDWSGDERAGSRARRSSSKRR